MTILPCVLIHSPIPRTRNAAGSIAKRDLRSQVSGMRLQDDGSPERCCQTTWRRVVLRGLCGRLENCLLWREVGNEAELFDVSLAGVFARSHCSTTPPYISSGAFTPRRSRPLRSTVLVAAHRARRRARTSLSSTRTRWTV